MSAKAQLNGRPDTPDHSRSASAQHVVAGHRIIRSMTLRLAILLAAVSVAQVGPTLEQYLDNATGPGRVDCGTFSTLHNGMALPPRRSSKAANKVESMRESLGCAAQALKDHKGFKIVQSGPAIDSELASGVLGNSDGVTSWFESDSAPCGGPGCARTFKTRPCSLTDVRIFATPRNHVFKCDK